MTLSSSELRKTAAKRTGLSDFGEDEMFCQDFDRLVDALDMARVPLARRAMCSEYIVHLLINRLWFEHDWKEHCEIAQESLLPPVAIVSLPRAGTTKLQRIMAASDGFQNLHYWQTHSFARIPNEANGGKVTRLKKAIAFLAWLEEVLPGIMQTHPMAPEDVEEEYLMMEASFRSIMLSSMFPVPEYSAWLATASMAPAYAYLVRQLKYMQWQFCNADKPKPWLLKSPGMLGHEDQLTQAFPQGLKIISLHRAPEDVIPSTARTAQFMHFFGHMPNGSDIGPSMLAWFSFSMQRYMDWRKSNTNVEILDLSFQQITNDSIATAEQVCNFLGTPLTNQAVENIKRWDVDNPQHKHGKNEVLLEQYGLDSAQVRYAFGPYIEEYGRYF